MANSPHSFDLAPRAAGADARITAVLGPTNTGKTHYALERMLAHRSGMIGLPLRLLAREVYDRVLAKAGARAVALVTGEEKIVPPNPRYWVSTVEAMPLDREVEFLAVDEIQLAADPERGRIFTSRLMNARGLHETLFLGSDAMRPILRALFGNLQFLSRSRFSKLTYAGPKKVTRLPRRTAIVGFSSDTVYAIAELIRRQRGGAAVVLGALSPRTRNAQAELYQSGEVDFLIATDAIGMGLNMDIDHVAFAARRKFDGRRSRDLAPAEMAQIAGRAGRHIRDGTFGVTADCPSLDEELVEAIEDHQFDPVRALQWRSESLDFNSIPALLHSLERKPPRREFIRARSETDEDALRRLVAIDEIRGFASGGAGLITLWDVCQIPDFRKTAIDHHARLLGDLYLRVMQEGAIDDDWLAPRIERLDRTDGDIDAISSRIAHIRTWTYLSHRPHWIERAAYWQERARAIEDALSDALHDRLTQRFVDRRTSTLMKRLKDDAPLLAGVTDDGEVIVEGQFIGRLLGFDFIVDPRAKGAEAKSLRAAGERALRPVLAARAAALANAEPDELTLEADGSVVWRSSIVARLRKGPGPLRPDVDISGLDQISANMRGRVADRLRDFVAAKIEGLLGPLVILQQAANAGGEDALQGLTKGVAYRIVENFGAVSREQFGDDLKQIDQKERAKLRQAGLRFGEYTLFVPALLKPAPAQFLTLLWALWTDRDAGAVPPPKAGLVSVEMVENLPHAYYYAAGYRPSGNRAVRIDMLERLAGLVRTARNEADMREGFEAGPAMMSLVGCSGEDFEAIMRSLGFRKNVVKRKPAPRGAAPDSAPPRVVPEEQAPENGAAALGATGASPPAAAAAAPGAGSSEETAPEPAQAAAAGDSEETAEATSAADQSVPIGAPAEPSAPDQRAEKNPAEAGGENAAAAPQDPSTADADEPVEIVLWRPAPRRTRPPRPAREEKSDARSAPRRGKGKKGKPAGKSGKPPQKGGKQGERKPRRAEPAMMHEPRHRRTADPNSPFAVLAGLKSQLSDDEREKNANKKTEPATGERE